MTASASTRKKKTRAAFIAALPGTYTHIAAASGLSLCTVKRWIRFLRAEQEIHIGEWRRAKAQGAPCAVYVLGAGEDAVVELLGDAPRDERLARLREIAKPRAKTVRVSKKEPATVKPARKKRSEERREVRIARAMTAPPVNGVVPMALLAQRLVFPLAGWLKKSPGIQE